MITVLGARGFIGSRITEKLREQNEDLLIPERDEDLRGKYLGDIIFCIGLTADAKRKPFETIEAHITKLIEIIQFSTFNSITYASSARVYVHSVTKHVSETDLIPVDVSDPFELFNLTKLTAESLLQNTVKNFRSVRYSNVYGTDRGSENFLTAVISEALERGKVTLHTTPDSEKDYISVDDAATLTIEIARRGKHRIYNVASGTNVSNRQITDKIKASLSCGIDYSDQAKQIKFPEIDVTLIREEFGYYPSSYLMDDLDVIIASFKSIPRHEA